MLDFLARRRFWALAGCAAVVCAFLAAAVMTVRGALPAPSAVAVSDFPASPDLIPGPLVGGGAPADVSGGGGATAAEAIALSSSTAPTAGVATQTTDGSRPPVSPGTPPAVRGAPGPLVPALPVDLPIDLPGVIRPPGTKTSGGAGASVRTVRNGAQLRAALAAAGPGSRINVAAGTYPGGFTLGRSGTADAPVVISGPARAHLTGGLLASALRLDGVAHVRVSGLTMRRGEHGVLVERSSSVQLSGITVADTRGDGIRVRGSRNVRVTTSVVRGTGGAGVAVGAPAAGPSPSSGASERVTVQGINFTSTRGENVLVHPGSTGGTISANLLDGRRVGGGADSWITVAGNGWRIIGNTGRNGNSLQDGVQTDAATTGWGRGNTFAGNTLPLETKGYGIYIHQVDSTGNTVACSNKATGVTALSNLPCR